MKKVIDFGLVVLRVLVGPLILVLGSLFSLVKLGVNALGKTFEANALFGAVALFTLIAFVAALVVKSKIVMGEFLRFVAFSDLRDLDVMLLWLLAYLVVGVLILVWKNRTSVA